MTMQQPEPAQLPAVIEKPTGGAIGAYIPTTFDQAMNLARVIFKSGLAPETLKSEGAVFVAMAHGAELGLKPMQAIRLVNVIKGKPTLSADGIVAVILASGVCEVFEPVEESPKAVTWRTRRKGQDEKRATFTIEEAQAAGLVNDMYRKWPKRMLSARCKAFLGRDVYPDVVGGVYTPEEASEIPTPGSDPEAEPAPPGSPPATEADALDSPRSPLGPLWQVYRDLTGEPAGSKETEAEKARRLAHTARWGYTVDSWGKLTPLQVEDVVSKIRVELDEKREAAGPNGKDSATPAPQRPQASEAQRRAIRSLGRVKGLEGDRLDGFLRGRFAVDLDGLDPDQAAAAIKALQGA
jgi:hypothetical protein